MNSKSDNSSSEESTSKGNISVKSAIDDVKAAMKLTLKVMAIAQMRCDEEGRSQMQHILHRYKDMNEEPCSLEKPRVLCLDNWRTFGARTVNSFRNSECAYEQLQDNMKKLKAVEEVYKKNLKTIKKKLKLEKASSNIAELKNVKSIKRAEAGKKKWKSLRQWHDCVTVARKNLDSSCGIPKKGTPFYEECKRLMKEK